MRRTVENRSFADMMKSKAGGDGWQVKGASYPFSPGPVTIGEGKDWATTDVKGNGDDSEGSEKTMKGSVPKLSDPHGGAKSVDTRQQRQVDMVNDSDNIADAAKAQADSTEHVALSMRPLSQMISEKNTSKFAKTPTFVFETDEVSDLLQDPTPEGRRRRHDMYIGLADASKKINEPGYTGGAIKDNPELDDIIGPSETFGYSPEPKENLIVYGKRDKSQPLYEPDGAPPTNFVSAKIPMDAVAQEKAAREAAQAMADAHGGTGLGSILGNFIGAMIRNDQHWPRRDTKEIWQESAQRVADDAEAKARRTLIEGGYTEEKADELMGKFKDVASGSAKPKAKEPTEPTSQAKPKEPQVVSKPKVRPEPKQRTPVERTPEEQEKALRDVLRRSGLSEDQIEEMVKRAMSNSSKKSASSKITKTPEPIELTPEVARNNLSFLPPDVVREIYNSTYGYKPEYVKFVRENVDALGGIDKYDPESSNNDAVDGFLFGGDRLGVGDKGTLERDAITSKRNAKEFGVNKSLSQMIAEKNGTGFFAKK